MKNKNLYEYTETVLIENSKEENYWFKELSGDIGSSSFLFKELLIQVRKSIIEADENQNYPMEMIIQKLKIVSLTPNNVFI